MALPTFAEFTEQANSAGYPEVLERVWAPGTVVEDHTHPFAVDALVVQGLMWLTIDGHTRQLLPGDRFTLAGHQPHAERYGDAGATYWAARRSA